MLSNFFYFFAIFDMNGSKRWFQTKFWFWLKHVLLVAFLNSTFFNNNKTYCIIQHKKMLILSTIVLHFFCFLQKGYFCKRNVFLAVYPKIYFVKLLFCKKNIKSQNQNYTVVFIQKKNFLLFLFGNGEIQIHPPPPPKENKKLNWSF